MVQLQEKGKAMSLKLKIPAIIITALVIMIGGLPVIWPSTLALAAIVHLARS